MTLFMNCFVTNHRMTHSDRGLLPHQDRLDIFKYMLASMAVLPITRSCFNIGLDRDFAHREEELQEWITGLFGPKGSYLIDFTRARTHSAWQEKLSNQLWQLSDDDLVLFFCNDDHIFLSPSLDYMNEAIRLLREDPSPFKACALSHWPEHLKVAAAGQDGSLVNGTPIIDLQDRGKFLSFRWPSDDSYQIVNARLLRSWFRDRPFPEEHFLPRSDGNCWGIQTYTCYVPKKEQFRHFEGYSTAGMPLAVAPPLMIPDGFFEGDIKVKVGGSAEEGWTLFNPELPYRAVEEGGCDYKGLSRDIPLFWKDRISQKKLCTQIEGRAEEDRRGAIRDLAFAPHTTKWSEQNHSQIPEAWLDYL